MSSPNSTDTPSVDSPPEAANPRLQPPASGLQPPESGLQPPESGLQPPESGLQPPASSLQPSESGLQPPASSLRPPETKNADLPVTTYTPDSALSDPKRLFREMRDELRNSRELALALFHRDLKAQFRQSILGYAWLFFPPIATTLVWFFLNSSGVVTVADTGMPYPAFVMIGTLLWQAFLESLTKPIMALNGAKAMLVKLNFPRIAPVLAGIGQTTLTSAIRLILLIPVFLFSGLIPSWTIIFFPVAYLAMVLFGTALGSLLTPIGLLYTDVTRAISMVGQFAMYATPVVYPVADAGLLGWVNRFNPITYLVEVGRATLVGGPWESLPLAAAVTVVAFVLLLLGWTIFHVTVPRIIERMGM